MANEINDKLNYKEIWKNIDGYENKYQISNFGRVRNCKKNLILKPIINKFGYLKINLYSNKKMKTYLIHRLVAQAFIPNPNNLPIVHHKDENPSNPHVNNLEWCTQKHNLNCGNRAKKLSKKVSGKLNGMYGRKGELSPTYGLKKTEEQKKQMSEVRKGKKTWNTGLKGYGLGGTNNHAKKVICDGMVFDCIKDCAEFYSIKYSTMAGWLNNDPMRKDFIDLGLKFYIEGDDVKCQAI